MNGIMSMMGSVRLKKQNRINREEQIKINKGRGDVLNFFKPYNDFTKYKLSIYKM